MKFVFACTFPGWATKYIEATNKAEAREKALSEYREGNMLPPTNPDELAVMKIS
ncbi:MAG: hypothetical protein G01um10143_500 [Parcubacteria group bacterium Gr01-1014_3]|nr:MAG: hypothetical protein G01um10143_500 [Parcubacteria group bacterium Gr01-1014_3]